MGLLDFFRSPVYIGRLKASEQDRELLKIFDDIGTHIRTHGTVVSDNTPGDGMAAPFYATRGFKITRQFNDISLITASPERDREGEKFGRSMIGHGANTLKTKGLRIYSRPDIWCHPIYLRFDRGTPDDLRALGKNLLKPFPLI